MKFRMIIETYDAKDPLDFDTKHRVGTEILWLTEEQYALVIDVIKAHAHKVGRYWKKNEVQHETENTSRD